MGNPAPTIKDIALKAGVSYSTVSRAINGKKGVKPEVRETVLKIANEINYFPHSSAKALVQKRVGVIGVIIPRTSEFAFQNPFYSRILLGLSSVANEYQYQLMLSINNQVDVASLYYRRQVDGIVVIANRIHDKKLIKTYEDGIPVVAVPGFPADSGVGIPSVNSENAKSMYRAVRYLMGLGHRRIGFIMGKMDSWYSIERLSAFKQAFADKGIFCDENLIRESDFSKTAGFRIMGELLDLAQPPTSVICMNDSITPGALHQIHSRKLSIPDDISILAIGCSDMYELFHPPLTTIKTPVIDIGKKAAAMLIKTIENGDPVERHHVLDSDLIIRESTGELPRKETV
ncbi:LacI family DNA-binding transcriptional regulator [Desulfospira joergensenii]|uniref:LacI family DNA-binding transcriptional regulator n=1 Tax=Desulfospira joergensenii TaxID=53329 RepID=UPI0003B44E94|nr:LacI family DNA-binding transcriptional regulator [Desulfospira joergensenii]